MGSEFIVRGFDLVEVAPFVNWDSKRVEPETTQLLYASQILNVALGSNGRSWRLIPFLPLIEPMNIAASAVGGDLEIESLLLAIAVEFSLAISEKLH